MDKSWYVRFALMVVVVAMGWLVLWPSLDTWIPAPAPLRKFVHQRLSPGLDIRGGLRLTYDVEVDEAVRDRRNLHIDNLTRELGERLGIVTKGSTPTREQLAQVKTKVKAKAEGER
ncbi:MAG TPA: hypothetical protein VJQ51_07915, partial [Burkholderiales bacterium]|nr:hypothetical protein [Burkholderiales bacterium]